MKKEKPIADEKFKKINGVTKPGNRVEIHWNYADGIDMGYIYATEDCRWDEADVFVHITETFEGTEIWTHMYDLVDNDLVEKINVTSPSNQKLQSVADEVEERLNLAKSINLDTLPDRHEEGYWIGCRYECKRMLKTIKKHLSNE